MEADNSYLLSEKSKETNGKSNENQHTILNISEKDDSINEIIDFNVSGTLFKTTGKTLDVFPKSMFGTKEKRDKLLRIKTGEIFINRSSAVFESVLTFYQTGILDPPARVNPVVFVKDINYYGLDTEALICGLKGFEIRTHVTVNPKRKWQAYMWRLLEIPDSSFIARIVSMFSLSIILLSIVIFCWETVPSYNENIQELTPDKQLTINALHDVEVFCISYFTIELVARFLVSPNKRAFLRDFLNIIDFVSILPFYLTKLSDIDSSISIYFLRAIRLVRVFRVFKLSRHSSEMKILGVAIKDSVRELGVLVFFILLGVLLFSSAIYYAEGQRPDTKINSIPGAFWWSIVTMTTVGYGDEVPVSIAGRIVGAICAMTGILVISMPIPIIVNNFTRHYQRLKPISKFFEEFQLRDKLKVHEERVPGLYSLNDLDDSKPGDEHDICNNNITVNHTHTISEVILEEGSTENDFNYNDEILNNHTSL